MDRLKDGMNRGFTLVVKWTDIAWIAVIGMTSVVCLELFYRMIVNFNDKYPSDMRYYAVTLMQNGEIHDRLIGILFQFLYDINQNTLEINIYLAAVIAGIIVTNFIVISFFIKDDGIISSCPRWPVQFFSVAALFIGPMYIPYIHEWYYLRSFSSFAWHSPTQQSMTLFSMIAALCFLKMYVDYDREERGIHPGWWVATTITALLSAMTKPSFLFSMTMAVVLLFVIELIQGGKTGFGRRLARLVIMGTTLIPSGVYIILLYYSQFLGSNRIQKGEEHEVIFDITHFLEYDNLPAAVLCGMAFTIVVFVVNWRRIANRKYRFVFGVFLMGLVQWACLTETGRFAKYGNFTWGLIFGTYFLTLAGIAIALENLYDRDSVFSGNRKLRTAYFILLALLLLLQICSQLMYFKLILTGHGYMR